VVKEVLTARLYKGVLAFVQIGLLALMPMAVDAQAQSQQQPPPAAMTELSQQGRSLKPDITAPDKGLATSVSELLRSPQYARVLNNIQMLKRGVWSSRGTGFAKQRAGSFNSGNAFTEFGKHTTTSGVNRFVLQNQANIYDYNIGTSTETAISTLAASNLACLRSWNGTNLIITSDAQEPRTWNGNPASTATALGGWTPTIGGITYSAPGICEAFNNRMVFAGFDTRPFTLVLSDYGNPATYTTSSPAVATDCGAISIPSQLGAITSLFPLRVNNDSNEPALLIGCTRGMAMLTGSSPSTFTLRELTRAFGVVNNRCWAQVGNDVFFLATDGIRRFSNVYANSALQSLPDSYAVQDLISLRNTAADTTPFAVHHPSTQEIQFWFPINAATQPNACIVLNYNTKDPSNPNVASGDVMFSTKDGYTATCGIDIDGVMYHGTTTGYLMQDYNGDTNDGTAISWEYLSPYISSNSPAQNASARKFIILTEGPDQKFTAQAFVIETLSNGQSRFKAQDSAAVNQVSETITKYGTWASGNTTTYPKLIDFESKGSGRFWAVRLTGSASGEHIDLVGIQSILVVGGWRQ